VFFQSHDGNVVLLHDGIALSGDAIEEIERGRVWSFDEVYEGVRALCALVETRYT
jgi:hypothetical protein